MVLLYKLLKCLFNGTQDPAISRDYGWSVGIGMGYILLFECNAPSTGKEAVIKKKIIKK